MKRSQTLLVVSAIFLSLFTNLACRKTEGIPSEEETEAKFFRVRPNTQLEVQAIATAVEQQNGKEHFVNALVTHVGYAKWDKAIVAGPNVGVTTARSSSDSNDYIVYIPFVKDTDRQVTACLTVKVKGKDTTYKMLYAKQYAKFGFDETKDGKWNARNVFQVFSLFDYYVFGHKNFAINDKRLFKNDKKPGQGSLLLSISKINDEFISGKALSFSMEICVTFSGYWYYETATDPGPGEVVKLSSGADWYYYEYTNCTAYYIPNYNGGGGNTGGGFEGGGGGGGGTGGGSWYATPECVDLADPKLSDLPCSAPVGWIPVLQIEGDVTAEEAGTQGSWL